MSRLAESIAEFCPNGVEYKKIADLSTVARGIRVVRNQLAEEGEFPVYQNSIKPLGYYEKANCPAKTTFVIGAGAAGEIGYCDIDFWAADDCYYFINTKGLDSRYLYYVLLSRKSQIYSKVRKASVPRLARTVIENLVVPVPPIEIQYEIVRILDNFTELTAELVAELTAELTARKKQYKYYREKLLSCDINIQKKTLDELCDISAGGDVPKESISKEKTEHYCVPIISNGIGDNALYGYTDVPKITESAVTIAARGTIGYAEFRDYPYFPIIRLLSVIPKDKQELDTKYLYYCLQAKTYNVPTSGIPQLTAPMLKREKISIPSLEVQKRIVNVLDNFDTICTELNTGLLAEIEARQKQYEYYRDKLLNFKELNE